MAMMRLTAYLYKNMSENLELLRFEIYKDILS